MQSGRNSANLWRLEFWSGALCYLLFDIFIYLFAPSQGLDQHSRYRVELRALLPGFCFPPGEPASSPALGPTHPITYMVCALSLGVKRWCLKLTTHLHLMPSWIMMELHLHSPIRLHGVVLHWLSTGTTIPFTLFALCQIKINFCYSFVHMMTVI
jgi:hypothetical protein